MNKKLIPAVAAAAFLPLLAHAQAYKCHQSDGSLAFQDQPCRSGAAGRVDLAPVQGYTPEGLGQVSGETSAGQRSESTEYANEGGNAGGEQGSALYLERLRNERRHDENRDRKPDRVDVETRPANTRVQASNNQPRVRSAPRSPRP
jgi:hypothetical protein